MAEVADILKNFSRKKDIYSKEQAHWQQYSSFGEKKILKQAPLAPLTALQQQLKLRIFHDSKAYYHELYDERFAIIASDNEYEEDDITILAQEDILNLYAANQHKLENSKLDTKIYAEKYRYKFVSQLTKWGLYKKRASTAEVIKTELLQKEPS